MPKPKRRRNKGAGRVYEYPKDSGMWWAQLPERDGKSGPKWRVSDEATGEEELAQKLDELRQGIKVYDRSVTLGEWLIRCIESDATGIGPTTYETYRQHARLYILCQPIAQVLLADLAVSDLEDWLKKITKIKSERTGHRYSANTIRRAYSLIVMALLSAIDHRHISWLPPKTLKLPPINDVEKRALDMEECNLLIDAATNLRLGMMVKTYIATGMREAELIGLQWDAIDWKKGEIRLKSQLKWLREQKCWERLPLKNRKNRHIPLALELLEDLRDHRDRQMADKRKAGADWQENGLVFPTSKGTIFSPRNLIDDIQRDAEKAGIGKITVHELRHTAGSLMLQAGKTMTTVSKILGHSSVGVTEKIYAHAFDEDKRDAVASVTRRLRRVGGTE